jgi:type IV pilus assembly protein PilC
MNNLKNSFLRLFNGVPFQEKVNFARHLSVTTESGLPILDALRLIQKQTPSKSLKKIIEEVARGVNNGLPLSSALQKFDYVFGDFFINLVRVGETSGNLSEVLGHIALELKKQKEIRGMVRSAMIYPAVILCATIGVTIFLVVFIFPKILPVFVSLGVELPFATKLVIVLLRFVGSYGAITAGGLVILVVLVEVILSIPKIHLLWDRLILKIPIISGLVQQVTLASFTRSLSILLKSGMNIVDALDVAKQTFHNKYYQEEIGRVSESVRKGESIARYLNERPALFPPMFTGMIQVGENTGNLEQNLLYLADYYESEVDEGLKNLTSILEPILLLFMGLAVGFVALAIITPIYKVTQGLKAR